MRLRVVDGEAVVLVQDRAVIVGLDSVGTRVIGLLANDSSPQEIAAGIRRQLEAGAADVEGDVLRFLTELVSLGVVELVDAPVQEGAG
ncbi:MAG TPA: PqqD family protein [Thermoanaerobaculaceae bacterium]|nr:PqqD family protein [Thermoanaerobaculaceae bacterium]HPS76824.1 PqqD family protein [Thermoanaerobaculaceae bacterium]